MAATTILTKNLKDGSRCSVTVEPDGETSWQLRVERSGDLVGVTRVRPYELPREKRAKGVTHALIVISGKVSIGLTRAEAEAMSKAIDYFVAQREKAAREKRKAETDALSAKVRAAAPDAPTRTISHPYSVPGVGRTERWTDGTVVTSLRVWNRYYREDGMSFGADDDSGYVYYALVRDALPEEAAPVLAQEEKQRRWASRKTRINAEIVTPATRPAVEDEIPDLLALPEITFGDSLIHLRVDQANGIVWVLRENGADGDNWAYNNYRGYIATRVQLTADRDALLAQLAVAK